MKNAQSVQEKSAGRKEHLLSRRQTGQVHSGVGYEPHFLCESLEKDFPLSGNAVQKRVRYSDTTKMSTPVINPIVLQFVGQVIHWSFDVCFGGVKQIGLFHN